MALSVLSIKGKSLQLQDGTTYSFIHVVAREAKPTFLLLHGFPSSSYDWRHQIPFLVEKGYGVIVPDLLGYGDTDSPEAVEHYSSKRISDHVAEILTQEGVQQVIGVGHDWGSGLLARLYTWHPESLLGLVFTSVGYMEPGVALDVDAINAMTQQYFGYPTFGYWKFFEKEEASVILDANPESLSSLCYPADPLLWKTYLAPIGGVEKWISEKHTPELPSWITSDEEKIHDAILAKKGYKGPLNWYKATIQKVDLQREAEITEEQKHINLPTLLVVSDEDYVSRAEVGKEGTAKWAKDLEIAELHCGHWIQLEVPDKFNDLLEKFAIKLQRVGA
ncbi:putative epoxide hydrolase 2 [Halenospora varia]|nr:putative epoxide hydrolase 2 [Halenospora varia]